MSSNPLSAALIPTCPFSLCDALHLPCQLSRPTGAQELLARALPSDRGLERRFKEWITAAHQTLDKNVRFENMGSSHEQVRQPAPRWLPKRFGRLCPDAIPLFLAPINRPLPLPTLCLFLRRYSTAPPIPISDSFAQSSFCRSLSLSLPLVLFLSSFRPASFECVGGRSYTCRPSAFPPAASPSFHLLTLTAANFRQGCRTQGPRGEHHDFPCRIGLLSCNLLCESCFPAPSRVDRPSPPPSLMDARPHSPCSSAGQCCAALHPAGCGWAGAAFSGQPSGTRRGIICERACEGRTPPARGPWPGPCPKPPA